MSLEGTKNILELNMFNELMIPKKINIYKSLSHIFIKNLNIPLLSNKKLIARILVKKDRKYPNTLISFSKDRL